MDMSEMGEMGGMDMGSDGLFRTNNMAIARGYWYAVAGTIAVLTAERIYRSIHSTITTRKPTSARYTPSSPANIISQIHETVLTLCREISYPQLLSSPSNAFLLRFFTFSFAPLGNIVFLLMYWAMVLAMLWTDVILQPDSSMYAYKWEIVGFRAAWVTVTQLPLIFLLSSKLNPITILTGISYERLNWLHRSVSITMWLTAIIHWSFFFTEWSIADFVQLELQMMPMVKYGFGAWAVLGWTIITSFGFFRDLCYELWVAQHLAAAGTLLWLLYVHVPSYARYNIWFAISVIVFDRGFSAAWVVLNNLILMRSANGNGSKRHMLGYHTEVRSLPEGYLHLKICDVNKRWEPGQHVFIRMPRFRIWESHPFTIATSPPAFGTPDACSDMEIYLKVHTGITGRLAKRLRQFGNANMFTTSTLLSLPLGKPPLTSIVSCDALIFIATSTGASFTTPLLEYAAQKARHAREIRFVWVVRHRSQLLWFRERIATAGKLFSHSKKKFVAQFFVTCPDGEEVYSESVVRTTQGEKVKPTGVAGVLDSDIEGSVDALLNRDDSRSGASSNARNDLLSKPQSSVDDQQYNINKGRPASWEQVLLPVVANAAGETVVVACGGHAMLAEIRNCVAYLSDARGAHKGSGAEGIFLHCESYGW